MKKITKLLMLSFVGLSAANANANANANAVYTVEKDILFKTVEAREIKLDLYLPITEAKVDGKYPLLVGYMAVRGSVALKTISRLKTRCCLILF